MFLHHTIWSRFVFHIIFSFFQKTILCHCTWGNVVKEIVCLVMLKHNLKSCILIRHFECALHVNANRTFSLKLFFKKSNHFATAYSCTCSPPHNTTRGNLVWMEPRCNILHYIFFFFFYLRYGNKCHCHFYIFSIVFTLCPHDYFPTWIRISAARRTKSLTGVPSANLANWSHWNNIMNINHSVNLI